MLGLGGNKLDIIIDITRQLQKGNYKYILEYLTEKGEDISLDWLANYENNVSPEILYCFLDYIIAIEDSAKNRILLCNYLMYMNEFFNNIYDVIRYHVLRPINSTNDQNELFEWALFIFDGDNPDSPFSKVELNGMKQSIAASSN